MVETKSHGCIEKQQPSSLIANLASGQELTVSDAIEKGLVEGLSAVSSKQPATFLELGRFIYGNDFNNSGITNLIKRIDNLPSKLANIGLGLKLEQQGEEVKLWLEPYVQTDESSRGLVAPRVKVPALVNRVADNLWKQLSPLDQANLTEAFFRNPESVAGQIDAVIDYLMKFKKGKVQVPTANEILSERGVKAKEKLAVSKIQALVSISILEPQNPAIRTVAGWGRQLNDLLLLLGSGWEAKEILREAIDSLDVVSRAIFLSQISMSKRFELLKVAMDQVNEREMAFFINTSVYIFHKSGDAGDLEEIILTTMERDASIEPFSAARMVEAILEHYPDGADYIFDQLIKASKQLDFWLHLADFFGAHPDTSDLAHKISSEYGEETDNFVPRNRRL